MLPGPLSASPPKTDQATAAAPPVERVAVNCSTDVPCALAALQPVQLVSMEPVPGEMEKVEFEGSAVTRPAEHPAANSSAGAKTIDKLRKQRLRMITTLRTVYRLPPRRKGSEQLARADPIASPQAPCGE